MSAVLSTVILTSVLCIIVFAASNVANDTINGEIETAQFDQAKNVMLAVDKLIKRIMYKPESLGYVKTSFWTVTPSFVETGETITVTAAGQNLLSKGESIPVNIVKIKGGSRTSVAVDSNLIGTPNVLLTDISGSLGRVYTNQSIGAWITLDYARVRCISTGTSQFFNTATEEYETYNIIEITIVALSFGQFEAQEKASFIAKNTGLESSQKEMPVGDFTILVQKGSESRTCTLQQLGGNIYLKTLINTVVVNIEISIIGDS